LVSVSFIVLFDVCDNSNISYICQYNVRTIFTDNISINFDMTILQSHEAYVQWRNGGRGQLPPGAADDGAQNSLRKIF